MPERLIVQVRNSLYDEELLAASEEERDAWVQCINKTSLNWTSTEIEPAMWREVLQKQGLWEVMTDQLASSPARLEETLHEYVHCGSAVLHVHGVSMRPRLGRLVVLGKQLRERFRRGNQSSVASRQVELILISSKPLQRPALPLRLGVSQLQCSTPVARNHHSSIRSWSSNRSAAVTSLADIHIEDTYFPLSFDRKAEPRFGTAAQASDAAAASQSGDAIGEVLPPELDALHAYDADSHALLGRLQLSRCRVGELASDTHCEDGVGWAVPISAIEPFTTDTLTTVTSAVSCAELCGEPMWVIATKNREQAEEWKALITAAANIARGVTGVSTVSAVRTDSAQLRSIAGP